MDDYRGRNDLSADGDWMPISELVELEGTVSELTDAEKPIPAR